MGGIPGMFGLGGGSAGTGFAGPQGAGVVQAVQPWQTSDAFTRSMEQFQNQAGLLQALQSQNGIQNQSNVYNQLQGVANGTGPNPAQAMLNQQTSQNVANQAALMAGQRGAASNVGLLARQGAQQGANLQQQAVGQGATLQAQQALGALGQLGELSTQQVAQQQVATNTGNQLAQNEQQMLLNQITNQNNAAVNMQSNVNSANAGLINTQLGAQKGVLGGVMNTLGGGASMMGAEGGEVKRMAYGGQSLGVDTALPPPQLPGPQSDFGKYLFKTQAAETPLQDQSGLGPMSGNPDERLEKGVTNFGKGISKFIKPGTSSASNGLAGSIGSSDVGSSFMAPAMLAAAKGGNVGGSLKGGGHVPGKPSVGGATNSYKNDNVKALLSPGEIVLPRSVTQSKDPVGESAKFVANVISKRKGSKK